uniref:Proteasome subunit beta n=1 Tax=Bigelowiella natans TaxID=227086 RepID=Q5YET9_BIGNA|nr:proteasome beta subunit [Bigelowiella natans]|eukprot:jgi/Bigna1/54083/estExt_Genewise1Plus.C_280098
MSILQYNGSAIVAMVGKDCVAIASDMRYGIQQQTIACDMKKVFQMGDKLFIGLSGLLTDVQTLKQKFDFKLKMYSLRENRPMRPKVFSSLVSSTLYEKRFGPYFVEPVVAGLDAKEGPFIAAMDLIGAPVFAKDFVVSGTTSDELYGVCEAFWKPNMGPDELFETISQSLLAAVDRDCLAGWGAIVHVITKDGVTTKQLKSRKD